MNNKVPLEDVPLNSYHKKLTFYSSGGPFLDGYVLSIIGVVMLQMTEALKLSMFWQGMIAASALIGMFLGAFLGGWITDKYGRKFLYLLDLIAIIGFSLAQFWVESAFILFVLRILIGMAVGADFPIATSYLAEFLPRKNRGPRLAAMVMVWFLGAAVAYAVGEILLHTMGDDAWRWALASAVVPGVLFLAVRMGAFESPRWLLNQGRIAEADKIIKKVYGNEYSHLDLEESKSDRSKHVSVWALFHSGYGKRMLFVSIFWTCAILPLFAVYAFAPQVLKALGLTGDLAGWGAVAITFLFLIGCLIAMMLVNVMGRKKMLFHSFLWSGIALLILGVYPNASSTWVLFLFSTYAVLIGGAQVLEYVYPNELFPTEIRGSAVGLGTSISRVGAAIGTYLLPFALAHWGVGATMVIAAVISFIGAWSAWALAPNVDAMNLQQAASLSHDS